MAQARSGSKVQTKINMLVYGVPFSGKSTFALQMARLKNPDGSPFKLLILDAENGGCDTEIEKLEQHGVALENVYVVYTQSLEEVNYYIKLATDKKDFHVLDDEGEETEEIVKDADGNPFRPNAILVDGTSVLRMTCQQSLLNLSRKRAKVRATKSGLVGDERAVAIDGASLEYKDWNTLGYSGQSLILNLAASGLHYVATSREKAETESRMVNGSIQSINTGKLVADTFKGADYNCNVIARMFRDDDEPDVVKMEVLKDRTGTFSPGQIVEDPSILAFQPMIDKKGGKEFVVKNSMDEAVEIETKMYQKQAGILDEDTPNDNTSVADPDSIKNQIKAINSKLYPDKKKEFGNRLKIANLPTAISKIDDIAVLNQILDIAKEISGD